MEVAYYSYSMRLLITSLLLFLFLSIFSVSVYAQSDYVLPYPPAMPGNSLYKLRLLSEAVNKYWSFGDFAQFKYNLNQADKYLVQAKTLYEYKQYLLGYQSLEKSNSFIKEADRWLRSAQKNNKNTSEKEKILISALQKHREVLLELQNTIPETVEWRPENGQASSLELKKQIVDSIKIRDFLLNE